MSETPVSVGGWNVQAARRHEHLGHCPIMDEKCRGEKCELWLVDALECAIAGIAKGLAANGG